ncbi:hypothetical protein GCM10027346_20650 [Hymenobacter seoulensis]
MAGERLAKLVLEMVQPDDGQQISIWLAGAYRIFTARTGYVDMNNGSGEYQVIYNLPTIPPYPLQVSTDRLAYVIQKKLQALGLGGDYTVTSSFHINQGGLDADNDGVVDDPSVNVPENSKGQIVIQATRYDDSLDFQPSILPASGYSVQFRDLERLSTIKSLIVKETVVHATIFGAANGSVTLAVSNGTGSYAYAWADGPTTRDRANVAAGNYPVTVTDTATGANTTITVLVGQPERLTVVVDRLNNDVTLRVSGGIPGYTYLWEDGSTTSGRLDLEAGTYTCLVTDSAGATVEASVTIDSYRFYFSQNPVLLELDAGEEYRVDPTTKPNLSFLCEVLIEPDYMSENFVRIGDPIEQPADRMGRTTFEVQALLDAYLKEHLPDLDQPQVSRADSLFKRFYLKYWERFGEVPEDGVQRTEQQNYVLLGGLDFYEYAARTWFNTYQAAAKPFLTWQPDNKLVYADQPEYLYFMANSFTLAAFKLKVRVTCSDGSLEEFDTHTYANPRRFEVFCLPVGYLPLGLSRFESATRRVISWVVQVIDDARVPQSEQRRYRLEYRYAAQRRYFLYTNSLGGVNTLACIGEGKATLTPTQEEADRGPSPYYNPLDGDSIILDTSGPLTLTVNTGLLKRADMVNLQDFVLSARVTLQRDGAYWPGKVKAKALEAYADADTVLTHEFDFVMPRQRLFTPRLPVRSAATTVPVRAGEGGAL